MKKNSRRMFIFVFCVLLTILGIYMTFFYDRTKKSKESMFHDGEKTAYVQKEDTELEEGLNGDGTVILPDYDNKSANETYTEGIAVEVYFTNTDVIDKGNLPVEAHAILPLSVQRYLNRSGFEDVTELYVDEDSYEESEDKISFDCFMDGHKEYLRIVYDKKESQLEFSISE